jgi:penicillin-binding protein 1B
VTVTKSAAKAPSTARKRRPSLLRRRWVRWTLLLLAIPAVILSGFLAYYYVQFSREIEVRLHGERDRVLPRVFARPLDLWRGQALGQVQLVDRLNDLGYAQRAAPEKPGEFGVSQSTVLLVPRGGDHPGIMVRAVFEEPRAPKATPGATSPPVPPQRIAALAAGGQPVERVTLDPPLLTALMSTSREKRRQVPLESIPPRMIQAVLAIEDRRFYEHPGVDPIRMVGALLSNIRGDKRYLAGASTITQQLARNFFLTEELAQEAVTKQRSVRRKLLEQFMALILERKASKDEILELYLNDVYLGQRGSFAIHGVAEASRLFFGKDVSNVSLPEAATIAGVIQSPFYWSPFHQVERSRTRRNVVLGAMAEAGYVSADAAARASAEPITVVQRALDAQAPYFIDLVGQTLAERFPSLSGTTQPLDVYTTLDIHLQRLAQDALRDGIARVDEILARKKRRRQAQAALIAVDPRTGNVLALVGGRTYNQSQFNRAMNARRQPGSTFKPFVYLAAFERAAEEARTDLTPASMVMDEPTTFTFGDSPDAVWTPSNYEGEYDGEITFRRALAMSRNVGTIHVAEQAGFDKVSALWKRVGVGQQPHAYPSITLGVFEVTPFEMATAYTVFPNGGELRPLQVLHRVVNGGRDMALPESKAKRVARPDTTFLVTNMMRSVINEGTGSAVRAGGFAKDAAGKTGTTNDLRDAWFIGFTPDLLTAVWVGLDDNQPLGLSGAQVAAPIWAQFMARALQGEPDTRFKEPEGITWVDIDRDTGKLAEPGCPRVFHEAFLSGTEPTEGCELHRF